MHRHITPARIRSVGERYPHYVKKAVGGIYESAVAADAEGCHGKYLCHRINIVGRICRGKPHLAHIAFGVHLGDGVYPGPRRTCDIIILSKCHFNVTILIELNLL